MYRKQLLTLYRQFIFYFCLTLFASNGIAIQTGLSVVPREVIDYLDGDNLLKVVRSFADIDATKINSFTTNRHAQVICAWNVGSIWQIDLAKY